MWNGKGNSCRQSCSLHCSWRSSTISWLMSAVKQSYGEKVPIQGTSSVVLPGLLAAHEVVGGTLTEHTYLFLAAGEAGTGIAELIALEILKQRLKLKSAERRLAGGLKVFSSILQYRQGSAHKLASRWEKGKAE